MRLISLAASNTEILWALGLTEWLVGVDDFSDFPPEVQQLPRLGPDLQIDLGRLEALQPDLVLSSLSVPGMERVVEGLEARGIPQLVLDPESLEDVYRNIEEVAERLGYPERGKAVVGTMRASLEELRRELADHPPLRVMVEWWPRPVIAAGGRSWVSGLLEAIGLENAFGDRPVRSQVVSSEEVEAAQPEMILVSWCGAKRLRPELVMKRSWQVPALQAGRVYPLPEAYLGRPGPRLIEGARQIGALR
jgi:iron complex transport system substrate-binding protein